MSIGNSALLREIIFVIRSKRSNRSNKEYLVLSWYPRSAHTHPFSNNIRSSFQENPRREEKYIYKHAHSAILPAPLSNRNEPRGKLRCPILLPFMRSGKWDHSYFSREATECLSYTPWQDILVQMIVNPYIHPRIYRWKRSILTCFQSYLNHDYIWLINSN